MIFGERCFIWLLDLCVLFGISVGKLYFIYLSLLNVFMLVFELVMDLLVLESGGKSSIIIMGRSGASGGKASIPTVVWAII